MSHEEFKPDDIFINRIKSHPKLNFFINDSEVTIGYHQNLSASNNFALNVPKGYLSLYEMNINRDEKLIYPFLYNGGIGAKGTFRQQLGNPIVAERTSQSDLCGGQAYLPDYDQPQAGSYPMSASIVRVRTNGNTIFTGYGEDCTDIITLPSYNINKYLSSLQNVAKKYTPLSGHFILSSSVYRPTDLTKTSVNMIDIPSIFYGSSLKKGSVTLSNYISGSLIAEASDIKRNGELIETTGSSTGTVVGIVMYDEGIMLLTASHELSDNSSTIQYGTGAPQTNQWIYFGTGCNDGAVGSVTDHIASASFNISCQGTSYLNSMTLFVILEKENTHIQIILHLLTRRQQEQI